MGRIRWRATMAIDRGLIDEDHRHLIDIINRFGGHLSRGQPDLAAAVDVLNALKFYADTHFEREEELQRLVDYPEHQTQRDDHQRLRETLNGIIARTRSIREAEALSPRVPLGPPEVRSRREPDRAGEG